MGPKRSSFSLFDRWSASYDRAGLQRLVYRPIHDAVLSRIGGMEPSVVVDLGCGTGQLTRRLIERFPGATVVGADLSAGMLCTAAGRLVGAGDGAGMVVRADAHHLPFARESVDLVVCTESFHWYRDQPRVVDGLAAALRPGGRLLIASIATFTGVGDQLLRRSPVGETGIRALPPGQLRALLRRSGFDVLHQRRVPRLGFVPWPALTDARRR